MITKANLIVLLKVAHRCIYKVSVCSFNSKVPTKPFRIDNNLTTNIQLHNVDLLTMELLERLSLVNFENEEGIEILESSIKFAGKLIEIDTSGAKPLISALETLSLHLRDDNQKDGHCRKLVVSNAKVTEEEYFVAPPGNIPLEPQAKELLSKKRSS